MKNRHFSLGERLNLLKSLLQSESAAGSYFQKVLLLLETLEEKEQLTGPRDLKELRRAKSHIHNIIRMVEGNRQVLTHKIDLLLDDQGIRKPWCLIQTISWPELETVSREAAERPVDDGPDRYEPTVELEPSSEKDVMDPDMFSEKNGENATLTVALLTLLTEIRPNLELVRIIADQLEMLLEAGYKTKLLVSQNCPDEGRYGVFSDHRIEWVKVPAHYSEGGQKAYFNEAREISAGLAAHLSDVDYCILHDILAREDLIKYNLAIRMAQKELKSVRFIAMSHKLPEERPVVIPSPFSALFTPMPKTEFVHPNYSALPALAEQYQVPEGRCRVVNYSFNMLSGLSHEVRELARQTDLISPDILIVYPAPLLRERKFEWVVALAAALKKVSEKKVKVVFCDFPGPATDAEGYRSQIGGLIHDHGFDPDEIVFSSQMGYPGGISNQGVLDLFILSNLYLNPADSDNFGLTVLEAASRGNFLVLNESVPRLTELGRKLNAYLMRWDGNLEDHAHAIVNLLRADRTIQAKTITRQRFSPNWVWKNHLQPILET